MLNLEESELYGIVHPTDHLFILSEESGDALRAIIWRAQLSVQKPPPPPPPRLDYVAIRHKLLSQAKAARLVDPLHTRKKRSHKKKQMAPCPSPTLTHPRKWKPSEIPAPETEEQKQKRLAREIEELTAKLRAERGLPP